LESQHVPLERLDLHPMASGEQSLLLTEVVGWGEFPSYAQASVSLLDGETIYRADSPVERAWTARIRGGTFWVSLEDFPAGVSPEPHDSEAGRLIPAIRDTLKGLRNERRAV
jgi:hypothetical protein